MAGRWVSKVLPEDEIHDTRKLMSPAKLKVTYIINFEDGDGGPEATLQGSVELQLIGVAVSSQDVDPTEIPFE